MNDWRGSAQNSAATVPLNEQENRPAIVQRLQTWWKGMRKSRQRLLIGVVLVCFLLAFGGIYSAITITHAVSAARDAKAQAQAIESILKSGQYTDVATLTQLKNHLQALSNDLNRIQSDIPGGPVAWAVGNSGPGHALNMGRDLSAAGIEAVDAGLIVIPHIKGMMASVTGGNSANGALTLSEINQASADMLAAGHYATLGLAERAKVSDSSLQSLGLGSLVKPLHALDSVAPKLPSYLAEGQDVLSALPDLLGLNGPTNYLLFDLDSDELRPTGGFQGVYGVLTFNHGLLTSGVHLQNVYALECPQGLYACQDAQLPASYDWYNFHDGMRNANLDPNYPTSAKLDEQLFSEEHGAPVAGVISITPHVIEQILTITGTLTVPGYPDKVTASNFRELIHYYHDHVGQNNVSQTKVFDAAAGSALLSAVGKLSQSNQMRVMKLVFDDLRTKDIQAYFNDTKMEAALTSANVAGALQTPVGDTYELVNNNYGGNYANMDVTTTQSDNIIVDAQGRATHTLTVTYHFPVVNHRFPLNLVSDYQDDIELLAPRNSQLLAVHGCTPMSVNEPGWADFSCGMTMQRGATATVVFQWRTPPVVQSGSRYSLLVQRQSGTSGALSATITLPTGSKITAPLMTGLKLSAHDQVVYSGALSQDIPITLTWAH